MPTRDECYITPTRMVPRRFAGRADLPRWDVAILCFRDLRGSLALVEALGAVPFGSKVFWGMEETAGLPHVYTAEVSGKTVCVLTRCLWGGPQAAILVEELAFLGTRHLIGCGAAGSIDASLPQGAQIVVASALPTDGTSLHYATQPIGPDPELLKLAMAGEQVTAATVDAIYRETPQLIRRWRQQGARVINMEAAPFYAAAAHCGVAALWLGNVSDVLGDRWEDWFVDRTAADQVTIRNCLDLVSTLAALDPMPFR